MALRIGFDIDGVLADMERALLYEAEKLFGPSVTTQKPSAEHASMGDIVPAEIVDNAPLRQELQLPLVRDVRGDAARLEDVRHQVVGDRELRQLRVAQRGQLAAQFQYVERRAALFAPAGAEEFTGPGVLAAHRALSLASKTDRRIDH